MSTNCLLTKQKEATNNISAPYLGGIAVKLKVTDTPLDFRIDTGRVNGVRLQVLIKIEGDGNFVDSGGTSIGKTMTLDGSSDVVRYVATGEVYLHIPLANLGVRLTLQNSEACFDIGDIRAYERADNSFKISILGLSGTNVYGDISTLPSSVAKITMGKYVTGNIAELNNGVFQYIGSWAQLEYKGSRKGSDVKMITLSSVDLGADFDNYIKDCAECTYQAADTTNILVRGTTSYDTDTDVQDAVAAVYSKGIANIYLEDEFGVRRRLGNS